MSRNETGKDRRVAGHSHCSLAARPKRGGENGQKTEKQREKLEERERHGSKDPPLQRSKAKRKSAGGTPFQDKPALQKQRGERKKQIPSPPENSGFGMTGAGQRAGVAGVSGRGSSEIGAIFRGFSVTHFSLRHAERPPGSVK